MKKMNPTNQPFNKGDIVDSQYRIVHQLSQGGFSRTYLAEDLNRFNERYVIKEFAPQLEGSCTLEKAQELFKQEAEIIYRLQHPQIPKFRELFWYQHQNQERLLLVEEYIEGTTYHTLINNYAQQGRKFSEAEIIQLLYKLLPVLEYIHSMGVIHRDIAPDNLILRSADQLPILIDFGSIIDLKNRTQTKLIDPSSQTESLCLIGTTIGKSGYAPPEQISYGIISAHSDLYALAATAVVLLTAQEPQKLIDPINFEWNWQQEVNLSPKLRWVLSKMLAPIPKDRFGSATEVIQALQDISVLNPKIKPVTQQTPTRKIPNLFRSSYQLMFFVILATSMLNITSIYLLLSPSTKNKITIYSVTP